MDVEYYWSATRKEQTKEWSSQTKQRKTKNKGFSYTVAKVSKNGQWIEFSDLGKDHESIDSDFLSFNHRREK